MSLQMKPKSRGDCAKTINSEPQPMQDIPTPRPMQQRTRAHRHLDRVVLHLLVITLSIEVHVVEVGEGIVKLGL